MKINIRYGQTEKARTDVRVFLFNEDIKRGYKGQKNDRVSLSLLRRRGFSGKKDEVFESYDVFAKGGAGLVALGLGDSKKYDSDNARRAGGELAKIAARRKLNSATVEFLNSQYEDYAPFTEGLILGGYVFDRFKSGANKNSSLRVIFPEAVRGRNKSIKRAALIAEAACYARDLVNTPGNYLTPTIFANRARSLAKKYGIKIRIYGPQEIMALKMGALIGVAQGSAQPPRLIHWHYKGGRLKDKPIVIVGKGVTFDSGGISLKPSERMGEMKNDMAGAAAVISLMIVLGKLKPRLNVMGIVPAVENLPSGKALKPGDIVTVADGQTIEIINTDAEGRLILADGLNFAHKFKPRSIIDIATLTGAARVALGDTTAAIMGNNEKMTEAIYEAGQRTAEKTWRLPLWDDYQKLIESAVADMKNSAGRPAGSITAACLLSRFVRDIPWVHIDIAAVDNQDKPHPYMPKGATGFGTRLLADYILSLP